MLKNGSNVHRCNAEWAVSKMMLTVCCDWKCWGIPIFSNQYGSRKQLLERIKRIDIEDGAIFYHFHLVILPNWKKIGLGWLYPGIASSDCLFHFRNTFFCWDKIGFKRIVWKLFKPGVSTRKSRNSTMVK